MKLKWLDNEYVQRYHAMIANGFRKITSPLLVAVGVTNDQ